MSWLLQGIALGLLLSILVGPLLLTLLQTSIEEGLRAASAIGLGIWVSDGLFVMATFFGMSFLEALTGQVWFRPIVGSVGGLILVAFGVGIVFSPVRTLEEARIGIRRTPYHRLWLKGFAINTFNPFTVFFWVGLTSTVFEGQELRQVEYFLFFVGILATIVVTDLVKIYSAKQIRRWLTVRHIKQVRRIAGLGLIGFGVALLIRTFVLQAA